MSNAAYVMKEVNIMETRDLSGAIHTTLPMEQLIELVESEIRELIRYDSFEYSNPQSSSHIFFGTPRLHKCHYRIAIGSIPMGQVTLSRSQPFDHGEINMIEAALGALIVHLHNAMDFQQELTAEAIDNLRLDRAWMARK
jgi:hypothetical protein